MGRLVETLAKDKGHEILAVFDEADAGLSVADLSAKLKGTDVAIDFSSAEAVLRNAEACCVAGVALVEGTTGWNNELENVRGIVSNHIGAFVFGANFSIGVNLFYKITAHAAELFSKFPDYEVFIEERHHSRKKDAPSGTALKLQDLVAEHIKNEFTVSATRAGNIPGTHTVGFDGPADQILLTHNARSREGFAAGAILAAEWVNGKKGFWEFTEVMEEIINHR